MGQIDDGPAADETELTAEFLHAYTDYLYVAPPTVFPELTGSHLHDVACHTPPTAAGLDGWRPSELRHWSPLAFEWAAALLRLIESGAPWPSELCRGRSAILEKPSSKPDDALSYRLLTILTAMYRLWARARVQHAQAWASAWDCPELCAGTSGKGAEDGWMATALELE